MANINTYGYQKLREYVIANWKYLELQDATGTAVKRFIGGRIVGDTNDFGQPIYKDIPGTIITGTATTQELTFTVIAEGAEFTGKTVAKVALFDVATGGTAIAVENFTAFKFESAEDQLTINFKLQVPQVL